MPFLVTPSRIVHTLIWLPCDKVGRLVREAFRHRIEGMPAGVVSNAATELQSTPAEATEVRMSVPFHLPSSHMLTCSILTMYPLVSWSQMYKALLFIIRHALYENLEPTQVLGLYPEGFHPDLAKLVSKAVVGQMQDFHAQAIASQPSLPRLQSVDWRVDVKTSSNAMSRMAEPTVIVNMQACSQPSISK